MTRFMIIVRGAPHLLAGAPYIQTYTLMADSYAEAVGRIDPGLCFASLEIYAVDREIP